MRRRAIERRRKLLARTASGAVALAALGAILATSLGGHGAPVSRPAAHAHVSGDGVGSATPLQIVPAFGSAGMATRPACPLVVRSTGYVNPLAGARVKRERIDQGVDYAGSGTLSAIGAARITYVATEGTGWPGAFIEYRLLNGPDAGCYVFYAEGVTPRPGLHVGAKLGAGQTVATIIPQYPTGFEIGWGSGVGTQTYQSVIGAWTPEDDQRNVATGPGKSFSALIASVGGPPGKVEG